MKRYCKNIRLDKDWIMACMLECFSDKWKRRDVAGFLAGYQTGQPLSVKAVSRLIQEKRSNVDPLLERAAEDLAREIKERDVHFPEIHYSMRYDGNSGKLREIGVESIKQQIYNYVAVNALKELFERKIGKYQCASVQGRGQVYGKNAIERWIRKNPDKTRAGAKADVRHCYPSINTRKLMRFLRKQVKNDDLLYLVETLIASYKQGLSIGSYLSQWLCNYYLSFAYHYAQQKLFKVQKRRGQEKRTRLFYKIIFYMDDILILGPRKVDDKMGILAEAGVTGQAAAQAVSRILNQEIKCAQAAGLTVLYCIGEKSEEQARFLFIMLIRFFREELGLEIKPNWKLFQVDYIGKDGKHHGDCIDMMGYKIYRDRTEVRRSIFLRARRAYLRLRKQVQRRMEIALDLAYRCISYYGWFKNSDSNHFKKKYGIEQLMKYAKRRVSIESKIHNRTAGGQLAAA